MAAKEKSTTTEVVEPPLTDNRNTVLAVGQLVAYNLSGEIAIGKIEQITRLRSGNQPGSSWSINRANIEIEQRYPKPRNAGHVSTVRGPRNVMVLVPAEAK